MQNTNLDRLAIGFLLGACLVFTLAAGGEGPSEQTGTYQLQVGPDHSSYILNTRTGRLWIVPRHAGSWEDKGHASGAETILPMPTPEKDTRATRENRVTFRYPK